MAEYLDEKILELQRAEKRKAHQDIYGDYVYIDDEEIIFKESQLFDGKLTIMLPSGFTDMPIDVAKIKYPSEQRPQIIKTNTEGSVNLCFNLFKIKLDSNQVEETINGFFSMLQKVQSGNDYFQCKTEECQDNTIGWFDFKSATIDDQLYNMLFTLPIDGRVCTGVFNCGFRSSDDWKTIFKQILFSIKSTY